MKYWSLMIIILSFKFVCAQSTIEKIGDVTQLFVPISAGVTTLILKDRKGSIQLAKAFLATATITQILKHTVNKTRPNGGKYSFPSGHTSSAFSGASFIARRYGLKYGIPAYALAAFTGYSRVYAKKHYIVDVLAGAIIGIGNTYLFTTPYEKKHFNLTFSSNTIEKSYLLGVTYKF